MSKGILYCVCDKAESWNCDKCPKGKRIMPDHTMNYPNWKRAITKEDREAETNDVA